MDLKKKNGLEYLSLELGSSNTAIVFFHGYGADASDLFPISGFQKFSSPVDWYFPQGILEVPLGPMASGRAWMTIENRDWDALSRGEVVDSKLSPSAIVAQDKVVRWLCALAKEYDRIVIGGFSQGAILLSHCFYKFDFVPRGLVLMSGYLAAPSMFPTIPESLQIPFFQSHGRKDPVLPILGAKKLYDRLLELGLTGDFVEFSGQHEIPHTVLVKIFKFIQSQIR